MAKLNQQMRTLTELARVASRNAYARYSDFPVGAAILAADGQIFSGCNVENASYGLTICAERNAVFQLVAAGQTQIEVVAIYTPTAIPSAPCGACRQVINEFGPNALIISICDGTDVLKIPLSKLLPNSFGPHNLE